MEKFKNPHLYLKTTLESNKNSNEVIESTLSKIKNLSNSGSTNSLIRHYRQSSSNNFSNNTTTSSIGYNFIRRRAPSSSGGFTFN